MARSQLTSARRAGHPRSPRASAAAPAASETRSASPVGAIRSTAANDSLTTDHASRSWTGRLQSSPSSSERTCLTSAAVHVPSRKPLSTPSALPSVFPAGSPHRGRTRSAHLSAKRRLTCHGTSNITVRMCRSATSRRAAPSVCSNDSGATRESRGSTGFASTSAGCRSASRDSCSGGVLGSAASVASSSEYIGGCLLGVCAPSAGDWAPTIFQRRPDNLFGGQRPLLRAPRARAA
jgi:hypothetical protein